MISLLLVSLPGSTRTGSSSSPTSLRVSMLLTAIERVIANTIATILAPLPPEIRRCQSILYTPAVTNSPLRVEQEIRALRLVLSYLVDAAQSGASHAPAEELAPLRVLSDPTALIIIDEADCLTTATLEQVRDIYDHGNVGMVLIGMPGLEKRLSRYPQLYSRVGFVHEFRA